MPAILGYCPACGEPRYSGEIIKHKGVKYIVCPGHKARARGKLTERARRARFFERLKELEREGKRAMGKGGAAVVVLVWLVSGALQPLTEAEKQALAVAEAQQPSSHLNAALRGVVEAHYGSPQPGCFYEFLKPYETVQERCP